MLIKEYLERKHAETEEQLQESRRKLENVKNKETVIQKRIQEIRKKADLNYEVFSPRAGTDRERLKEMDEKMRKIRVDMLRAKEEVSEIQNRMEEYDKMLEELDILLKNQR